MLYILHVNICILYYIYYILLYYIIIFHLFIKTFKNFKPWLLCFVSFTYTKTRLTTQRELNSPALSRAHYNRYIYLYPWVWKKGSLTQCIELAFLHIQRYNFANSSQVVIKVKKCKRNVHCCISPTSPKTPLTHSAFFPFCTPFFFDSQKLHNLRAHN